MKLRKLLGAAGFGLLASLLAHAAAYGTGHAMGGAYHEALQASAIAAGAAFLLAAAGIAWAARDRCADGSVIATRLLSLLPGLPAIATFSVLWFTLGEAIEAHHPNHATPLLALALLGAAAVVRFAASLALRFIKTLALASVRGSFVTLPTHWIICAETAPLVPLEPLGFRRYARPPPGAMHAVCI